MKLTSVEIFPENTPSSIVLSFKDPTAINPYNVKGINGLDADEIVPRYYGTSESARFFNLTLPKRDVVFKINLNPNFANGESFSDLRDILYKVIASSRYGRVKIQFKNYAEVVAELSGLVSKLEAPQFEKTQEVQITVKCDEPMLRGPTPVVVDVSDLNPANTIIRDDKSTAPHGFVFQLNILENIPFLTISDPNDSSWIFSLLPADEFIAGDVIFFSSEYNDRQIYLMRGEGIIYLADVIAHNSIWPILFPGENVFQCNYATAVSWGGILYYPSYWGV